MCMSHLNLIIQKDLQFIKPIVSTIKYIIDYIFTSPSWKQIWKQLRISFNKRI